MTQQCCGNCKFWDRSNIKESFRGKHAVCNNENGENYFMYSGVTDGKNCQVYEERKECEE